MLREAKGLHGTTLHALDGEIGSVDEILFDDEHWTVRYLIVATGNWLIGRNVLISPPAFGALDWERHTLNVNLTRKQIGNSPSVATDEPASRQWETNDVNDETWRIGYLAVDIRDMSPGKEVLLPPAWIGPMNWPDKRIMVNVTCQQVRSAPAWIADQPISRSFEDQLYSHYARQRPADRERPKVEMSERSEQVPQKI